MIDNKKIEEIRDRIAQAVSPEKIILFGSYATGTPTADSDVDLVVIWDSTGDRRQRNMRIRRLFPHRDFSLDVFAYTPQEESDYRGIKGTILYTALIHGKVLYERKKE